MKAWGTIYQGRAPTCQQMGARRVDPEWPPCELESCSFEGILSHLSRGNAEEGTEPQWDASQVQKMGTRLLSLRGFIEKWSSFNPALAKHSIRPPEERLFFFRRATLSRVIRTPNGSWGGREKGRKIGRSSSFNWIHEKNNGRKINWTRYLLPGMAYQTKATIYLTRMPRASSFVDPLPSPVRCPRSKKKALLHGKLPKVSPTVSPRSCKAVHS